jgi:hypothetical protein
MSEIRNHGFIKGMNRDISKNKYPNDAYYYLLNGRVLADDDNSTSDIINIKGNTNANINDNGLNRSNYQIIGYVVIKDNIVLFYASNTATGVDSFSTTSIIDILNYTGNDSYSREQLWSGQGLNFRLDKPIRAVARYESENVQKIYWTDDNNSYKNANIAEDISGYEAEQFDMVGNLYDAPAPFFSDYTSGSLKPGSICYAYRFVKKNGYKTTFTDVSELIPLGSNIYIYQAIKRMYGDDIYDPDSSYNTGQGVIIGIPIGNTDHLSYYDYIEVVSLWYSSDTAIPDVTLVSKLPMSLSSNGFRVIDDGTNNLGSLTYEEFVDQQNSFVAKDLVTKDNRLFAANLTEQYFDIDEDATWAGKQAGDFWDARAYRFDNTQRCELDKSNSERIEYVLTGPSPNYSSIPEEANALNIYNNVNSTEEQENNTLTQATGRKQRYQANGTTEGGSGINITYSFTYETRYLAIMDPASAGLDGLINPTDSASYNQLGLYKTFQRDEIYRFGIVFFDKKGRQSFVKWIGDIRIPKVSVSYPISDYDTNNGRVDATYVYPTFTLSNRPSIDGDFLNYQIVYVKREESDKSIRATGIAFPTIVDADQKRYVSAAPKNIDNYINDVSDGSNGSTDIQLINFISPEINFRDKEFIDFSFVHSTGELVSNDCVSKTISGDPNWISIACNTGAATLESRVYIRKYLENIVGANESRVTLSEYVKAVPPTTFSFVVQIDDKKYGNHTWDTGDPTGSPCGTNFTIRLGGNLTAQSGNTNYFYLYARESVYQSQYGGLSYADRQLNTFIPASQKIIGSTDTVTCRYGDTFITVFEHGKLLRPTGGTPFPSTTHTHSEFIYIACESSINCFLNSNDTYSRIFTVDPARTAFINEDPYVDPDIGLSFTSLYGYNSAYSKIEDSKKFFTEPLLFEPLEEQSTRIKYSDVKIDNEDIDSWLSFRANNYNDANENYGEINRLVSFQDRVFSFQDNAVSIVSINPRVTQQSQDGINITLGTGSVIDDFNYLTTDIGCQDNSDIVKSLSSLYWLDKNKKKIYAFGNGLESITDIKGLHTYLKNNITEDSTFIGVYDIKNSEVLMTISDGNPNYLFTASDLGANNWSLIGLPSIVEVPFIVNRVYNIESGYYIYTGKTANSYRFTFSHGVEFTDTQTVDLSNYITEKDNFTLSYSEKLQAFQSFYSFLPTLYVGHYKGYFSTTNNRDLYQHDIGEDYNTFYGTTYPTTLKLITNFGSQKQSEFTNLEFFCEMENELGELQENETMTNISLKDATQLSEDIILYPIHLVTEGKADRYVLDTSSLRIGQDWYTGLISNTEDLLVYGNELYRCLTDSQAGPPVVGANFSTAELANIRKTNNHWHTQLPRFAFDENGLGDPEYILSNRFRSDWLELTLEFKDTLPNINIEDRRMRLSDIRFKSDILMF